MRARPRGYHLRRNSSEISLEMERNTSTASAAIMPKAIIIFSGCALLRDGIRKRGASRRVTYLQYLQYAGWRLEEQRADL